MADFAARAVVAEDVDFRARVGIALTRVALQMSGEQVPQPAWNSKRVALAEAVLLDPESMAPRFALIVAARDAPLTATDDELENHVRDSWDSIAGVLLEDMA